MKIIFKMNLKLRLFQFLFHVSTWLLSYAFGNTTETLEVDSFRSSRTGKDFSQFSDKYGA